MITLITAHPWDNSFTNTVCSAVQQTLSARKKPYCLIDLYEDNFNPVLTLPDLRLFPQGKSADPAVARYQEILKQSTELVFIFPVWWYEPPAMLKGFLDKVLLPGFAYTDAESGVTGSMSWIERALVLTSSSSPTEDLVAVFGDPVRSVFINATLKAVGIQNAEWLNICDADIRDDIKRTAHLARIRGLFSS